jgi:CobQ-like glutamine amidotransferase family enzyme
VSLLICTLFPLATTAAGDDANGPALVRLAAQRGITAEHVVAHRPQDVPDADIYLLGGTGRDGVGHLVEQLARSQVAERLQAGASFAFAVDAGLDALARRWVDPAGDIHDGLGVLPVEVRPAKPQVGTVATGPVPHLRLPVMVGWVSTDVMTVREAGISRLLELVGDTRHPSEDGVDTTRAVGTRLHGPVLALNPELADLVLTRTTGQSGWPPLLVPSLERARSSRLAALIAQRARDDAGSWSDEIMGAQSVGPDDNAG